MSGHMLGIPSIETDGLVEGKSTKFITTNHKWFVVRPGLNFGWISSR